jgi:hypothetical protein
MINVEWTLSGKVERDEETNAANTSLLVHTTVCHVQLALALKIIDNNYKVCYMILSSTQIVHYDDNIK